MGYNLPTTFLDVRNKARLMASFFGNWEAELMGNIEWDGYTQVMKMKGGLTIEEVDDDV